jgi:hypothetical protein
MFSFFIIHSLRHLFENITCYAFMRWLPPVVSVFCMLFCVVHMDVGVASSCFYVPRWYVCVYAVGLVECLSLIVSDASVIALSWSLVMPHTHGLVSLSLWQNIPHSYLGQNSVKIVRNAHHIKDFSLNISKYRSLGTNFMGSGILLPVTNKSELHVETRNMCKHTFAVWI